MCRLCARCAVIILKCKRKNCTRGFVTGELCKGCLGRQRKV